MPSKRFRPGVGLAALLLLATGVAARAAEPSATQPQGSPAPVVPSPPAAATSASPQAADKLTSWSAEEISAAKAHCDAVLKAADAVATPEEPMRDGQCGAPYPVKLSRIGPVTFNPAPTLTCEMVAALGKWIKHDLQPLAKAHLGGPVTGISTMSSYSCRNAYGRVDAHLSEHGRANAIDIGGFSTAHETAVVLASWGPILREVKAQAAKDEALRRAAEAKARALEAKTGVKQAARPALPEPAGKTFGTQPAITTSALRPAVDIELPLKPILPTAPAIGFAPAQHLGGPETKGVAAESPAAKSNAVAMPTEAAAPDEAEAQRMQFLRLAHDAACLTFATVLGPEANGYHRNHFHLDMSDRKAKPICE